MHRHDMKRVHQPTLALAFALALALAINLALALALAINSFLLLIHLSPTHLVSFANRTQ